MRNEEQALSLTYTGAGTAFVFGLSVHELVAFGGFALGVLGYATQLFFAIRRDRYMIKQGERNET